MRHFFCTLVSLLTCLVVAAPAGAASGADHQLKAAQLQREADQAAARYLKGQTVLQRLDGEIAKLNGGIGELQAKVAPLREVVTRRVVAIYEGQPTLAATADPAGARLVAVASSHELDGIETLTRAAGDLGARQQALRARQLEQQQALDDLDRDRRQIELKLAALSHRDPSLQAHLVAAGPRMVSSRAIRGSQFHAAPPASDPASMPVATNFVFVCPIAGPVAFTDTFGDPRKGGRRHQGTDLMNPYGTPNVAVVSGTIEHQNGGLGGIAIVLNGDDGNTYYYAHLSEVVGPDRHVAQGEIVGRTGATGNAAGGPTHTHFEFHPGGGPATDAYQPLRAYCEVQLSDG